MGIRSKLEVRTVKLFGSLRAPLCGRSDYQRASLHPTSEKPLVTLLRTKTVRNPTHHPARNNSHALLVIRFILPHAENQPLKRTFLKSGATPHLTREGIAICTEPPEGSRTDPQARREARIESFNQLTAELRTMVYAR